MEEISEERRRDREKDRGREGQKEGEKTGTHFERERDRVACLLARAVALDLVQ